MARSKATKIRKFTSKAKAVGKEVNKYGRYTAMVPYSGAIMTGANLVVKAADTLANLMESFSDGGTQHPQSMGAQVAGVANNVVVQRTRPSFQSTKGAIRIVHKELVSTIVSNVEVGLSPQYNNGTSVFQVNSGSGTSFPWLSSIAGSYEFYKFHRVRLVYVPLCATTEVGRVMLGYDPDSTDPIPVDRQALSSMTCTSEASVWGVQTLDLKLSNTNKWYYSDASSVNANTAYNDQGQYFWAAWANKDSTTNLGELYVLYDVSLKDPQPNASNVDQALGTAAVITTIPPANAPYFVSPAATSLTVRFVSPGDYLVVVECKATNSSGFTYSAGSTDLMHSGAVQAGQAVLTTKVRVTSNFAEIVAPGLTALGTWEVLVTRIPRYSVYNNF